MAVINPQFINNSVEYTKISDNDFKIEWFSGTGKGGQRRNKVNTSCRLTHIPTGITESRQTRTRETSYSQAKNGILLKLKEIRAAELHFNTNKLKNIQTGSGGRGDKIRTYRFKDGIVIDHNTGKSAKVNKIMKGNFQLLW